MSKPLFAIGRGHGLYTPGKRCLKSIDPNETREFILNDRIADKVENKLANYECEVITIGDTTGLKDILLASRVNTVNKAKPDMYIPIHHDAGINGGYGGGTTVFYSGSNADRPRQAQALYDAIIKETGLVGDRAEKVIKKGFYVLAKTSCPALLIENGFMDSKVDTPIILTEEHAEKTANGIVNFLVAEFNLKKKKKEEISNTNTKVLEFQRKAIADGFSFPKWGADGKYGTECESVAKKAILKKRIIHKYKNLTKLVQNVVGVEADGKYGQLTKDAVIEYQKAHGLVPDGVVGINTWKVILGVK